MIEVLAHDGASSIPLMPVSHMTTAHDAAYALWASVHTASKAHGGRALMKTPEDGEFGYVVFWQGGPENWAEIYVEDEDAKAPGISAQAEEGLKIRFTDLD